MPEQDPCKRSNPNWLIMNHTIFKKSGVRLKFRDITTCAGFVGFCVVLSAPLGIAQSAPGTTPSSAASPRRPNLERPILADESRLFTYPTRAGAGALAGIPLYLYGRGWHEGDDYARGMGMLSARAPVDGLLAAEFLRAVTPRQRPDEESGAGLFLHGHGLSSSLPFMHATGAWALASVVTARYPEWFTQASAYGLATALSLGRPASREQFPSDIPVGSALGWLVGRYVSPSGAPTTPASYTAPAPDAILESRPSSRGSSYVPTDSWIYSALDRLGSLGLIASQTSGLRPWTLVECLRQVREAESHMASDDSIAGELVRDVKKELLDESGHLTLNSIYTRNGAIAGSVLNDSFHFGQTWINDSGRPFGRGWNSYTGFTASGQSGHFFAYINGEYQRAPAMEPYALPVREVLAGLDGVPLEPAIRAAGTNRFRLLDTYAGVRLGDFAFSAGKQSLWWGPTADSPLSFGDNAEPTKNFRVSTVHPIRLPGPLGILGEIRGEVVLGKLGGQKYTWRPWFNAQKLTFKLTGNLEMGFARWSIFWGLGHPITAASLMHNFTSTYSPLGTSGVGANDPGDRKAGFDFRYRVPGLRNWLTLYSDSYADDDPSPLAAPRRAAINPGIYLTHFPGIPRLDLRVEAPSTMPMEGDMGGSFVYDNSQYRSGNTNYGYLLGNAVGRDARGLLGRTTYWFSPRSKVEASYRHVKGGSLFLPGGSTQTDVAMKSSFALGNDFRTDLSLQYERFLVPLLGGRQRNISGWLQVTWEPNLQIIGKGIEQK